METIKVKYYSEAAKPISQAHSGEWIDLRLANDVEMKAGESMYLPLGVVIQLPEGYEAIMAARSSTFRDYGIIQTNAIGIIDYLYRGPQDFWAFPAYATRDVKIEAGTRIAQFRIQKNQGGIKIEEVDKVEDKQNRGGLGSTGKK